MVGVRSASTPPSPNPTCGITLGTLFVVMTVILHLCSVFTRLYYDETVFYRCTDILSLKVCILQNFQGCIYLLFFVITENVVMIILFSLLCVQRDLYPSLGYL